MCLTRASLGGFRFPSVLVPLPYVYVCVAVLMIVMTLHSAKSDAPIRILVGEVVCERSSACVCVCVYVCARARARVRVFRETEYPTPQLHEAVSARLQLSCGRWHLHASTRDGIDGDLVASNNDVLRLLFLGSCWRRQTRINLCPLKGEQIFQNRMCGQ
jgi:hypothetical protein